MSRVINAVFEDGVFKPLQKVDIKNHEKLTIEPVPLDEWQARFDRIIRRIHSKAAQYSQRR
jgi:predicted DNA-binding antitoxin AbrB/MazE fold protein